MQNKGVESVGGGGRGKRKLKKAESDQGRPR